MRRRKRSLLQSPGADFSLILLITAMALFNENYLVFSVALLAEPASQKSEALEEELLEQDDQYYFSKEQYFSEVKRGVVDLDEKCFKIYS